MKFNFSSIFSSKKNSTTAISSNFEENVRHAIFIIENSPNICEDEELVNTFIKHDISKIDAVEISIFLPIAFVRKLLPKVKWHDSYNELVRGGKIVEKKFDETESYNIILKVTTEYFERYVQQETVLKIAGRSAEFNSMNPLLIANPDVQPEDLIISRTCITK